MRKRQIIAELEDLITLHRDCGEYNPTYPSYFAANDIPRMHRSFAVELEELLASIKRSK